MRVVAFVPDLIDRSRISSIVENTTFVDTAAALVPASSEADIVLVDISRDTVAEVLPQLRCGRVIGFTNHTNKTAMEAARNAGVVSMARSDFFIGLEELLLGPGRSTTGPAGPFT